VFTCQSTARRYEVIPVHAGRGFPRRHRTLRQLGAIQRDQRNGKTRQKNLPPVARPTHVELPPAVSPLENVAIRKAVAD
jgi:hypothetical protein